jgi:DNA-binding MarR family transcriptional regulator
VIEGLAFSQRPIRAATKQVTERYDLGPRGAFILALVAQGISSPMELASVLCVGRSLITAELVRLTNAGLIATTEGTKDRRRLQLSLTPSGKAAREQVRTAMGQIVTENLSAYAPDELRLFAQMLRDTRRGLAG